MALMGRNEITLEPIFQPRLLSRKMNADVLGIIFRGHLGMLNTYERVLTDSQKIFLTFPKREFFSICLPWKKFLRQTERGGRSAANAIKLLQAWIYKYVNTGLFLTSSVTTIIA